MTENGKKNELPTAVVAQLMELADELARHYQYDQAQPEPESAHVVEIAEYSKVAQEMATILDDYHAWGVTLPDGRKLGQYEETFFVIESYIVVDAPDDDPAFGKYSESYISH